MQSYTYSIFSLVAIAIHLIINFDLLFGREMTSPRAIRFRGFLLGILAYYVTDALWGIFAELGLTRILYVDTIFFFLSLVLFVFMWGRFVFVYLGLGKKVARVFDWFGYGVFAYNIALLTGNFFCGCLFSFDAQGVYHTGLLRDVAFALLVAYNALIAAFVFAKVLDSKGSVYRRSMIVFLSTFVMASAIVLQIIWPLTPFTALGCLVGTCFLHVFVIQDEQTTKHTAELEEALGRAKAAEKARSMFFSIVSHDIRTPLNAILGYSELLEKGDETKVEREEALKSIRASGTTLLQLVNDVLDLAKIDAGKIVLHTEPVSLYQLTDEVYSSFLRDASKKGVKLVNEASGVPVVMLDGHRFRQILFNLIGNAVKFTQSGTVAVKATYAGSTLEVAVADTGCGIPPDMLSRILDPFVQVNDPSHSADRAYGTGLGLSICKRLAEAMGGELRVDSVLGRGSTFRIVLPNVAVGELKAQNSDDERAVAIDAKNLPKRVLIVDDSPVNRKVLGAYLKRAGVTRVDFAGNGVEALAALNSAAGTPDRHDFIFTDFWMPEMNGLELVEKLRADSRFADMRIFAVTADTEFINDSRAKLFNGILMKPLGYKRLVSVFGGSPKSEV